MLKSSLTAAKQISAHIKAPAVGTGSAMLAGTANVTVTVHGNCLGAYNEGVDLFARYQGLADRDADAIESFAVTLEDVDEAAAGSMRKITG
ncbi:MAG: hypothetical protein FWF88_00655 [Peptococcaceae bacterium]|nr:hypothetical protein [Peptococcaceae bacterium]